jgi:hypothetical protein
MYQMSGLLVKGSALDCALYCNNSREGYFPAKITPKLTYEERNNGQGFHVHNRLQVHYREHVYQPNNLI